MKTVFFGTPEFAVGSLDAIHRSQHQIAAVVTVPDRPTGRGQKLPSSPVKQYALQHHLPLLQPERLRDPQFLDQLAALKADIFVVVAFRMLPESVWNMTPYGTFNLHASLLPRYRGAAPINWAIINGEQQTGVTTDEGSILLQTPTPITPTDTAGTLHDRLAQLGSQLVVTTLDRLASGLITPPPQTGPTCPAPKIFKPDCQINLHQPAQQIVNHIRGLSPYPGAQLTLATPDGTTIPFKIFEATAHTTLPPHHPATIQCDQKEHLKIGVADGFIEILSLQMSGKRRLNTADFLHGTNITGWKIEQ